MSNQAAIETLERKLAELERKANAMIEVVNDLRKEDGLPPRAPFGGGGGGISAGSGGATLSQIRPDTFYGKKLQTAVREYLEMRFTTAGRSDPATPKEIYEHITAGGYQFDAKTEEIAMVGLRALLRKRTAFFHKLPNSTYGLTVWYPDAKKPKPTAADDAEDDDVETDEVIDVDEKGTATVKKTAAGS